MLDVEMRIDIAMAFENVENLEYVVAVTKDDDVAAIGKAPNAITKFRPGSSHLSRHAANVLHFRRNCRNEFCTGHAVAALNGNEFKNIDKLGGGTRQDPKFCQIKSLSP